MSFTLAQARVVASMMSPGARAVIKAFREKRNVRFEQSVYEELTRLRLIEYVENLLAADHVKIAILTTKGKKLAKVLA